MKPYGLNIFVDVLKEIGLESRWVRNEDIQEELDDIHESTTDEEEDEESSEEATTYDNEKKEDLEDSDIEETK